MTGLSLDLIRDCLEGFVPAVMATCDANGLPNVSLISDVHYVDPQRVALSYQFFNKTRRNVLATRRATVCLIDPGTAAQYRLTLDYEETQTTGPVFEVMKARLAGIASHSGMQDVFRLLGSDIYRVRSIDPIPGAKLSVPPARRNLLAAVRRTCTDLMAAPEARALLDTALDCLQRDFGIGHSMIWMVDQPQGRLFAVATRGYPRSGVGSEIALGEGVIGVAAREGVAIRLGRVTADADYGAAVLASAEAIGAGWAEATLIPYPGLRAPQSQIALPIRRCGATIGMLFAESAEPMRFRHEDEDALAVVAGHVGALLALMQHAEAAEAEPATPGRAGPARTVTIRHYAVDDSVFLDHDYLIKGVAGAIFRRLISEYLDHGRTEFTNRELRLDPALRLPEHAENLETRLILLTKRLEERGAPIRLERCGRGRFRLAVSCILMVEEAGDVEPRSAGALARK